jgi:hypothetical protein
MKDHNETCPNFGELTARRLQKDRLIARIHRLEWELGRWRSGQRHKAWPPSTTRRA